MQLSLLALWSAIAHNSVIVKAGALHKGVCDSSQDIACTEAGLRATAQFVSHVVTSVRWASLTLISDDSTELISSVFGEHLSEVNVSLVMFQPPFDCNTTTFFQWFRETITHLHLCPKHIITLGSFSFVQQIFSEVLLADGYSPFTYRWLTVIPNDTEISFRDLGDLGPNFQHVALATTTPDYGITLRTMEQNMDSQTFSLVAEWSPSTNSSMPNLSEDSVFPNLKYGLGGRVLRVVTLPWAPFTTWREGAGGERWEGLCIDLLHILAKQLNFTYTIREMEDEVWGVQLDNGTWAGMTGALQRKEADVAVAGFSITAARATVSDFTLGFYHDDLVMVTTRPAPYSPAWSFYTRPFHWPVYALLAVCLMVSTGLLICMEKCSVALRASNETSGQSPREVSGTRGQREVSPDGRRDQREMSPDMRRGLSREVSGKRDQWEVSPDGRCVQKESSSGGEVSSARRRGLSLEVPGRGIQNRELPFIASSLSGAAQALFGATFGRAVEYAGVSNAGRAVLCAWLCLSLVLVASYTGQLTANAVLHTAQVPFTSMRELLARHDYTWGVSQGTNAQEFIKNSSDPYYRAFYRRMLEFASRDPDIMHYDTLGVGLRKLLAGSYVRVTSYSVYDFLRRDHCQLALVKETLSADTLAFHLQKDSPLTQMFNTIIGRAADAGVLEFLLHKWFPTGPGCHGGSASVTSVSLELAQSAFCLAAAGVVIATIALVVELSLRCVSPRP